MTKINKKYCYQRDLKNIYKTKKYNKINNK